MSRATETRAAVLTPLAPGAIAVIGIVGPAAIQMLDRIACSMAQRGPVRFSAGVPTLCRIVDDGQVIDEAIIVVMQSADPLVEINTHGGVRVVQRVLELLAKNGATIIAAEQFHSLTSGLGEVEKQIDRLLVGARSQRLAEWLLAQRRLLPLFLSGFQSLGETEKTAFEKRTRAAARLIRGIHIAIVGPPNAGKSTLANTLIGHARIITSDIPGTTRDWVSDTALIQGWPITLTDTAGVRPTWCEIELEAIRRGGERARRADLVLIVIDGSLEKREKLRQVSEMTTLLAPDQPSMMIQNKADLVSNDDNRLHPGLHISALTSQGIGELETQIASMLELDHLHEDLPTGIE